MTTKITPLTVECHKCQKPLFRFTTPKADVVWCLECGASLTYEEVLKNAPGLMGGFLTAEELNHLRMQAGLRPK